MARAPVFRTPSGNNDHRSAADRYAEQATHSSTDLPMTYNDGSHGGDYASQVDRYAPRPKLAAGGPHNRPARGHESET